MEEQEIFNLLGFLKISKNRQKTLKAIDHTLKMPSEIAKETNIQSSQVSSALSDLKNKKIVYCVNEEVRKGRLYKCTDIGIELLKYLEQD